MAGSPRLPASRIAPTVPEYTISAPRFTPRLIPERIRSNSPFNPSSPNLTQSAGVESTEYASIPIPVSKETISIGWVN